MLTIWIAIGLAVACALLSPFGARLASTSLWLGKTMVPPEAASVAPRGLQSEINEGWPGWLGFANGVLPIVAILLGFVHAWWGGILVYVAYGVVANIAKRSALAPHTVDYFILIFLQNMVRRQADYTAKGDLLRAEAASDVADLIDAVLKCYINSGILAPTMAEARGAPLGEIDFLRNLQSGASSDRQDGPGN